MRTITLSINSRDLAYTIDTYAMFTGESAEECERQFIADEYQLTDEQRNQIDFNWDHPAIAKQLAYNSVQIIKEELQPGADPVVLKIELEEGSTTSPRFYNYTTDSYGAKWFINLDALQKYVNDNRERFEEFAADEWQLSSYRYNVDPLGPSSSEVDTFSGKTTEDIQVMALDFYTRDHLSVDDYNMQMWELETEAYMNNMTLAEESQAMLDNAHKKYAGPKLPLDKTEA